MDLKILSNKYPTNNEVLELFKFRCPKCRHTAYTVHELIPKSRGIDSMIMQNRSAICWSCHEGFHARGATKTNIDAWKQYVKNYLISIDRWNEYQNWGIENAKI